MTFTKFFKLNSNLFYNIFHSSESTSALLGFGSGKTLAENSDTLTDPILIFDTLLDALLTVSWFEEAKSDSKATGSVPYLWLIFFFLSSLLIAIAPTSSFVVFAFLDKYQ